MERCILVGVDLEDGSDFDSSMHELKALAEACDMEVCGILTQKMPYINKAFYLLNTLILHDNEDNKYYKINAEEVNNFKVMYNDLNYDENKIPYCDF